MDFGDLIMRPALLLENDSRFTTAVQLRHRHVLVDEYQDVNRASVRLVKKLCRRRQAALGGRRCAAIHLPVSRCIVRQHGRVRD